MEQLMMHWKNDGTPAKQPVFSEEYTVVNITELENGIEQWLDIMQYGLSDKREDVSFYKTCMLDMPYYDEKKCFMILCDGKAIASVTVICNEETKEGLIHMVGAVPESRGKGVGNMMGDLAIYVLKTSGMQSATLRTDDWRIPAIKSYLKIGFVPVLSTEDFVQRWDAIYRGIGLKD